MTQVRTPKRETSSGNKLKVEINSGAYTQLGYRSARRASLEGRSYSSGSGDAHMQYDRPRLIRESRGFYRDNSIYCGMIDTAVDYIIDEGFTLQVKTNSPTLNKRIEGLWKRFWARPEIKGLLSGSDVAQMICRELILAGDTGVIKTNKGVLILVEAEQINGGTKAKDGIEKDLYGSPQRFWISPYSGQGNINTSKARMYQPPFFLFITKPDRPSSTRGIPATQAVFPMLHRINDICDAEAIAWQMLSRLAVTVNKEKAAEEAYTISRDDPNKTTETTEGDLATRMTELDYAIMFWARPGEEIKGIERNIPGKDFSASLRTFLRLLGLPLGLPLELVFLDWTKSNYSQSRAVLEQAFKKFRKWQKKLEDFFFSPVFEWKLKAWKQSERFGNRKEIPYSWIKPTFPWIDQLKEAQACGAKVDRAFMTHGEVCKSRGLDREEVIQIREQEVREAIEIAKKIKTDTGVDVDWRIFAGLESQSSQQKQNKDVEDEDEKDKDNKESRDNA